MELFDEITTNLELSMESKDRFQYFLDSLDDDMKIFVLNRLFVRRREYI